MVLPQKANILNNLLRENIEKVVFEILKVVYLVFQMFILHSATEMIVTPRIKAAIFLSLKYRH